jgi:hypothetical protein
MPRIDHQNIKKISQHSAFEDLESIDDTWTGCHVLLKHNKGGRC